MIYLIGLSITAFTIWALRFLWKEWKELQTWEMKAKIRKEFPRQEVEKGEMLVLWRDVDDEVNAWRVKSEDQLATVAFIINRNKKDKLQKITGMRADDTPIHDDTV